MSTHFCWTTTTTPLIAMTPAERLGAMAADDSLLQQVLMQHAEMLAASKAALKEIDDLYDYCNQLAMALERRFAGLGANQLRVAVLKAEGSR